MAQRFRIRYAHAVECPYCGSDSRVLDSRRSGDDAVRRRRECQACGRRFTTYERVGEPEIKVHKRAGGHEPFERDKILAVLRRIARGRPVTDRALADLVRGLEAQLVDTATQSIASWEIAERVHSRLVELDPLLAQRFASNYQIDDGTLRFSPDTPSPQLHLPIPAPAPTRPAPDTSRRRRRPRSRKPQ